MRSVGTLAGLIAGITTSTIAASQELVLAFPLKCELGDTCFIQNYVDHDPSNQARDYLCGGRTYDGHNGTDIRVPDLESQRSQVEVLATAAGRVTGTRDGLEDVSIRKTGKEAVAGKECGNGVVVEHQGGWSTQYCHMARGSVKVKIGDNVVAGQPIGFVGLSGATEFPHLHLSVRRNGKTIDPFAIDAPEGSCGAGRSIWNESLKEKLKYRPREIINFGFAGYPPSMDNVESGEVRQHPALQNSESLSAYVRTIGLQAGDQQTLTLHGPGGTLVAEYKASPLDRDKAQYFVSSGRHRKADPWPAGLYKATYSVTKSGETVLGKTFELNLGAP